MLGHRQAEVSKRIDVFATAIYNVMRINDLNDALNSPWDPIQMSARVWSRTVGGLTPKWIEEECP
ncbi:MAG: hypothetical protein ACP5IL_02005 [Syntrophobacteraceae bacterium]